MDRSIRRLAALLLISLGVTALTLTFWQVIGADELVNSPHNPRNAIEGKQTLRGRIVDSNGQVLAYSEQTSEGIIRRADPTSAAVLGYYSVQRGASGLESEFDQYLRGDVNANPLDTVINDLLHQPKAGADLHLTLDHKLQAVAAQAIGSDHGAIVALDPKTGGVLAMVSNPSFDPNQIDQHWKEITSDPSRPLLNRATQGLYTPGSVFKIVTATAAIDLGLVDLDRSYRCTDDLVVDGFRIENKNHSGVSTVTFVQDFAFSCNVSFAKAGLGLDTNPLPLGDDMPNPPPWMRGIDETRRRFLDYAQRYGFETSLPFDLPTSESKVGEQPFSRVELANTAFGQGELLATPLLMASAVGAIANEGVMVQPFLVSKILDRNGNNLYSHERRTLQMVMSRETAQAMNRLMVASVEQGYAKPAKIAGVSVGGKTGSAEVSPDQKTHSWFIGYAPADNPKVAVAVVLENKGSGSDFAAPAARKVMEAALK
jgi:peptidoglycan glycosyltransferase